MSWLDKYSDDVSKAQNGIEGTMSGLTDKGFNYNGAWGGQFQMGGNVYPVNYVPQAQDGKLIFLQPTSEKLPEGHKIPYADTSSELAMSIGGENGEPAYLIPSFKYGKPLYDPIGEFKKTGEHLGGPFKTWQEADKWEQDVRHPAVEKKETIMFPQEEFAMGGSISGSTGFTYARTNNPAPSNNKYAKTTIASAQNGVNFKKPLYLTSEKDAKLKALLLQKNPLFKKEILDKKINNVKFENTKKIDNTKVVNNKFLRDDTITDNGIYLSTNNKGEEVIKTSDGSYKKPKNNNETLTQGKKKTQEEIQKEQETLKKMSSTNLGLRAPYHYLANPTHMLGDIGNVVGFKPLQSFNNSDEDARRYNYQSSNPATTNKEKLQSTFSEILNLTPSAIQNIGLGALATKTALGAIAEAYNPIPLPYSVGMKYDRTDFWKGIENNSDTAELLNNNKFTSLINKSDFLKVDRPLPKDLEPFISKRMLNDTREQEIYESSFPVELRQKLIDKRTQYLDSEGNEISEPNRFLKQGGVIKDDRGQWEHPGEITEINSPYITMQGVPYPVLGISDTGDTQMMYPEEEYKFDGKKVTEYPLAKNGKELVKLNQLTNFTNYNTKQPGGWLDKY
jgi:hypothetical protein